jgi:EAL domain-containing protein (putative c-di-GMP-specific phosphodiesterase class I)
VRRRAEERLGGARPAIIFVAGSIISTMPEVLQQLPVSNPWLERYPEQGGPVERVPLSKLPFTIGRSPTADHTVYANPVSKAHAAIVRIGDRYAVRDLHSTNGTFVNGRRIEEELLEEGDIIHLANVEFCFRQQTPMAAAAGPFDLVERTQALPLSAPASLIKSTSLLRELIRTETVTIVYEPIVDLTTKEVIGYEALARGILPQLPSSPAALLALAERCGMVLDLSRMLRQIAVARCSQLPGGPKLFLNVHAREVGDTGLLESLSKLREQASDEHPIVIEIAESSVTDVGVIASHRAAITALGFELAYDDFGAGQARLIELTDVPPAYLKLDKCLVHGIEAAARQEMVGALLNVTRTLGVQVIAEAIETGQVAAICERLGCRLGQGYFFCPPTARPGLTLHAPGRAPTRRTVHARRAPARRRRASLESVPRPTSKRRR